MAPPTVPFTVSLGAQALWKMLKHSVCSRVWDQGLMGLSTLCTQIRRWQQCTRVQPA